MILMAKGFFKWKIGVIGSERHWIFGAESGMIFVHPSRKMMKTGFHSEKEWNPVLKR